MLWHILGPESKLKKFLRKFRTDKWFLFPQQGKDSICHCLFIYNFALLQRLKAAQVLPLGYTQQHWLGITFPGVVAWQQAMDRLSDPDIADNAAFYEYQQYMLINGIHLDRIYTKSGRKYYKSELNPLKNLQKIWLSPYHFVSAAKHPQVLEKILPIYSDGTQEVVFDIKQNRYTNLQNSTQNSAQNTISAVNNIVYLAGSNKIFQLSESQQEYLQLPNYACLAKIKLSKPIVINNKLFKYGYKYQYLPKKAKDNIYFHIGLFQLLNLAMGIDNNNQTIDQQHQLFPVYRALRVEMTKSPDNPWGITEFNASNNLEHQLAKIFQADAGLMAEVEQVINDCPYNTFEHYEHLDNLYDSKNKKHRNKLADKKRLLPCRAQVLAYSFSQALLSIWSAAVSEKSLYAVLELPKILRPILYFTNRRYRKNIFQAIYGPQPDGSIQQITFMQVWQKLKSILQQQGITELFSFDGHGVVISFSGRFLQSQQRFMVVDRPDIMADLGFTVIDSLYHDSVKPWYSSPDRADIRKVLPKVKQAIVHSLHNLPPLAEIMDISCKKP